MAWVKDCLALGVIEDAERRGALKPGQTVVEATSGNTGIGLAMVCACKGYPLVVTMAESFSVERRKLMRFLGAKVVLTPASEKGSGMLAKAVELAETHGWCEFCWSVRNMLAKVDIPYRSIDLDSVEYQNDGEGRKIRVALCAKTGIQTIPQIFVGGELIGGCTEAFDAFKDGSLQEKLAANGVAFDTSVKVDPYTFLPSWLHPR